MEKVCNTHMIATDIVELFENVLDKANITLPSPEDNERGEDNSARIYGSVFSDLLDEVEDAVINAINQAKDSKIVSYVYNE